MNQSKTRGHNNSRARQHREHVRLMPADGRARAKRSLADQENDSSSKITTATVQDLRSKIADIHRKLQRLKEMYLDQDIEREDYRKDKNTLVSEKVSLEEQIARLERNHNFWLEPVSAKPKAARNP